MATDERGSHGNPRGAPDSDPEPVDDPMTLLRSLYGAGTPDLEEQPAATHWPSIPAVDAATEWAELREWVERLQERFAHLDHHIIPACWWRHNEHVEALAALRDHERVSFSNTAPATAPVDWFRALRDVAILLQAWTSEFACGATHQGAPNRRFDVNTDDWNGHVAADVASRHQESISKSVEERPRS